MKNILILSDEELEELYQLIPKDSKVFHKIGLEYKRMKHLPINNGTII